jgi:hypothetical protein
MNPMRTALVILAFFGALSGCAAPNGGGGGAGSGFERTETVPPDKMYGQSFVVERKILYGVKFVVQGGTTDAYILRVNDFNGNPKNTDSFKANALAKEMNSAGGAVIAELVPGSYYLLFDNPRTGTLQVSWSKNVQSVGK